MDSLVSCISLVSLSIISHISKQLTHGWLKISSCAPSVAHTDITITTADFDTLIYQSEAPVKRAVTCPTKNHVSHTIVSVTVNRRCIGLLNFD
jgi:hypothetical protein